MKKALSILPALTCAAAEEPDPAVIENAAFPNYRIENGGKLERATLLDETAGATYAIFEGLGDGIRVGGRDHRFGRQYLLRRPERRRGCALRPRASMISTSTARGFDPGSTEYDPIPGYNVYEVTSLLKTGGNALGEGRWTGMVTFEPNSNYCGDETALMAKLSIGNTAQISGASDDAFSAASRSDL